MYVYIYVYMYIYICVYVHTYGPHALTPWPFCKGYLTKASKSFEDLRTPHDQVCRTNVSGITALIGQGAYNASIYRKCEYSDLAHNLYVHRIVLTCSTRFACIVESTPNYLFWCNTCYTQ